MQATTTVFVPHAPLELVRTDTQVVQYFSLDPQPFCFTRTDADPFSFRQSRRRALDVVLL